MRPHFVVVPLSILEGWKQELIKWCSPFDVIVYHDKYREALYKKLLYTGERGQMALFNVLITSYSTFEKQGAQMKRNHISLKLWN
jgi:SNF2 family DNA or RNA helicase